MSIETQPLSLAAGESREVDFTGEYFELRAAVYSIDLIELLDRSGGVRARLKDPLESDFCRPGRFEKIRVTNGGTAQTVKFAFGSGDAGSRRSSGTTTVAGTVAVAGTVGVVDGGKDRTNALAAFMGGAKAVGGASTMARVQLRNENAAGAGAKRLVIAQVTVLAFSGDTIDLYPGIATLGTVAGFLRSKRIGSPDSAVGKVYIDNTAAAKPAGVPLATFSVPASGSFTFKLTEPIILPPGATVTGWASNANNTIGLSFEAYEEVDA